MAPLLLALFLLAQDGPTTAPADGPVATAVPRKQEVVPLPIQGGPVTPPTDDYGYVGWCFGAVSGYVELYDLAMPEVIRIERAFPTPSTEENIAVIYPGQRDEALNSMKLFKQAMEAAEKASPTPIQAQGVVAIRKGQNVWTGSRGVPRAQLAQFWMSWSPPAKCEETAKALEARSRLFGQALRFNAQVAAEAPPAPVTEVPVAEAPPAESPGAETPAITPSESVAASPPVASEPPAGQAAEAPPAAAPAPAEASAPEAPAPAPDPAPAVEAQTSGASAIDDLLDAAPTAGPAPIAEAPPPPPPLTPEAPAKTETTPPPAPAAKPAPAKPAPVKPARKRGLKETLSGLRGPL